MKKKHTLTGTKLAAIALVLTALVFAPIGSQAATVNFSGNTATGIEDVICGDNVLYDVEFVFDTGDNVYGEDPDFPFKGASGDAEATSEEQTYACSRIIQEELNAASQAITRVGPQSSPYFVIAGGEERGEVEGEDDLSIYGAFASAYYENPPEDGGLARPADTWVPADTWNFRICIGDDDPSCEDLIEGTPYPLGFTELNPKAQYSYAKLTFADGSPPAAEFSVGGKTSANGGVTGLTGSGLVLQNNGSDDLTISSDGDFVFTTLLAPNTTYSVTVKTQPSGQFCRVARGSGAMPSSNVEDVLVTCGDPPLPLDEIIATWSNGLWYWDLDTAKWTQLSADTTKGDLAAADFTTDGIADVAASFDFGPTSNPLGAGIYYLDGVSKAWTLIPNSAPVPFNITAGDVTGDGRPEVIGAWNVGIWYWDFAAATPAWVQLTTDTTNEDIAAADFTADGIADVAAIFEIGPESDPQGPGLYYLDGASKTWTLVPGSAPPAPFSVTAGDLTGDGRPEIIATWSFGIFGWDVAASEGVELSRDATQDAIAAGNFVRNGIADVTAIFQISPDSTPGGPGLYYLNGLTGAATQVPDSAPAPFSVTAGDVTGD